MLIKFKEKPNLEYLEKNFKEKWQLEIIKFLKEWYNNKSTININSSGTTHKIKIFKVKKQYMINSAYMTIKYFNLKLRKKTLLCLSIKYIAAKMILIRSSILKWNVFCINPSSNPFNKINGVFDFVSMVPLQILNFLNYKNITINKILIGGGIIPTNIETKIKKSNIECYHSYGMTETLGHIAIRKINSKIKYFKPLPEIKLHINNKQCLVIYAPKLMDKPLITKDIVKIYTNGYFEWIGRYDNIINTGGIKLNPEKIEKYLFSIIKKPLFIASIPDKYLGEKITLFIESKYIKNIKIPNNYFLNEKKYFFPKKIFFIQNFIRTFSGKIKRKDTIKQILKKAL